jgi:hypothetical protein
MIMEVMSDSAQYLVLCSYRPVAQEVRESRFFVRVVASHQIHRTGKWLRDTQIALVSISLYEYVIGNSVLSHDSVRLSSGSETCKLH